MPDRLEDAGAVSRARVALEFPPATSTATDRLAFAATVEATIQSSGRACVNWSAGRALSDHEDILLARVFPNRYPATPLTDQERAHWWRTWALPRLRAATRERAKHRRVIGEANQQAVNLDSAYRSL